MLCQVQNGQSGVELWEVGPSNLQNDSVDSCSSGGSWGSGEPHTSLHATLSNSPVTFREKPPFQQGLSRSRSFGGLLSPRRCSGSLRAGWADMGILGRPMATATSPRDVRKNLNLHPHVRVPKTPRPERAVAMTTSVTRGLRDAIHATHQDLSALHLDQRHYQLALSQGRVYEGEKQIKAAERYLKKIEYHLSKLEDLLDQYNHNQRLRDGVKSMAYAYALSPGKDKTSALSNVRSGYRECTETLCTLEVQIEQLLGTFTLEMKGIQGFARLCPGDIFEVVIRHGSQKWKTRGRVGKDNSQTWDNPKMVFKSLIGEMLVMKAVEVKILGKTVVIGSKVCETKDLFSPHPQLMTVNLNPSGSLKLNIVITWNPLDGVIHDDLSRTSSISTTSPSGRRRPVLHSFSSSPPLTIASVSTGKESFSPECDHDSSFGSMSARSSTVDSASPMSEHRGLISSQVALSSYPPSQSPVGENRSLSKRMVTLLLWISQFTARDTSGKLMTRSFPQLPTSDPCPPLTATLSQSLSHHLDSLGSEPEAAVAWTPSQLPDTLPQVISYLKNCLEDIQGQFPELHTLEESVLDLNSICEQANSRKDSVSSDVSLSIESALECFDFLHTEYNEDPEEEQTQDPGESNPSPNAVIEEKCNEIPSITGSSQLDNFLFIHLRNVLVLLQNLGTFGPLKLKEKISLQQLLKEGKLLSLILSHRSNLDGLRPQHIINVPHLQVLWDSVASTDEWIVTGKSVVDGLLPVVSSLVVPQHDETAIKVLEQIVCNMTGESVYDADCKVTAGHFLMHLLTPLQEIVPQTVEALTIEAHLYSQDKELISSALKRLKDPNERQLDALVLLLKTKSPEAMVAQNFIESLTENQPLLNKVLHICLLQIQSTSPCERSSACCLLGHLAPCISDTNLLLTPPSSPSSSKTPPPLHFPPSSSPVTRLTSMILKRDACEWPLPIDVLLHVQQNDPTPEVRQTARAALMRLGNDGKTALFNAQLSANGFQGVNIKEMSK